MRPTSLVAATLVSALAACEGTRSPAPPPSAQAAPPPVVAPAAATPVAPPADAAASDPERGARCAAYQSLLRGMNDGPPPGFPAEAIVFTAGYPRRAGSHPIPASDQQRTRDAIRLGSAPAFPRSGHVYVAAPAAAPASELAALLAAAPKKVEVRLYVEKSVEEDVAQHAAVFPHTPAAVRTILARSPTIDTAAHDLVAFSQGCPPVRRAFAPLSQGATLDTLPPATADGLAACECRMADLDGYVTLLGYLIVPFPRVGYVVANRAPFATAAPTATVGDVVAALPLPR